MVSARALRVRGLRPGCEQSRGTEQRTFQQPSPATSLQAATLTDSVLAFCHCNKMHERISSENKRLTVFLGLEVSFWGASGGDPGNPGELGGE